MNINILSDVYWSRSLKLIILYVIVSLFIIAIALLLYELTKKESSYITKQAKSKVIFKYNKEKTYFKPCIEAVVIEEEVIDDQYVEEVVEEIIPVVNEVPLYTKEPIKRIILCKNKDKVYLEPTKLKQDEVPQLYVRNNKYIIAYKKKEKSYFTPSKMEKEEVKESVVVKDEKKSVIISIKKDKEYIQPEVKKTLPKNDRKYVIISKKQEKTYIESTKQTTTDKPKRIIVKKV